MSVVRQANLGSEDTVLQRLRGIEASLGRHSRHSSEDLDCQLIALVSDPERNEITFRPNTARIDFPDADVAWSPEAASLYLKLLSEVPSDDAKELVGLLDRFVSASHATQQHVAASREIVQVALLNERQQIAALLPKKKDEQPQKPAEPPLPSAAAAASSRKSARKALDRFDVLAHELDDAAERLSGRMDDLRNRWKLAEVARAAQEVVDRSRATGDGGVMSQPLADLRTAIDRLHTVLTATTPASASTSDQIRATVAEHTATMSKWVEEFLDFPRQRARAYFMRMLDNVGTHPLLSIGALGGLLGLFAYAMALLELGKLNLSPVNLITRGDVTDFVLRLAPVFLLGCAAALSLIAVWVVALACDQRRPWTFVVPLAACAALLWLSYAGLLQWALPLDVGELDRLERGLKGALLVVLLPTVMLLAAGQIPGMHYEDRLQRFILGCLRALADSRGLLLFFIALGVGLIGSDRFSVLFAKGTRPGSQQSRLVLETKLYERPILIGPALARLSSVWVVRRIIPDPPSWTMVASSEVACVRHQTDDEQESGTLTNWCTNPRPAAAFLPDSIAGYASTFYHCTRESFSNQRQIAVMRFDTSDPKAGEAAVTQSLLQSTAEKLTERGLIGLVHADEKRPREIIDALADPSAYVLVLGFASTPGEPANNSDLSERRAVALRRELLVEAKLSEERADREGRVHYRGLGEGLLSGLFGAQDALRDQVAVAFVCDRQRKDAPRNDKRLPT